MNIVNLSENQTIDPYFAQAGAPGVQAWQPRIVESPETYTIAPITDSPATGTAPMPPHGIRELTSPLSD